MRKWSWLGLVLSSCVLPGVGLVDSFDDTGSGGSGAAGTGGSAGTTAASGSAGKQSTGGTGKQSTGGDTALADAGHGGVDSSQPTAGNFASGSGGEAGGLGLGGGGADNPATYDDGVFTMWPIPGGLTPMVVTMGPDQNLWFTEFEGNIGRMTPDGDVAVFPLPSGRRGDHIISGPDGQLWFTDNSPQGISRITTAGVVSEIPLTDANAIPTSLAAGPDGNVWGACIYDDFIVKITPQGALTKYTPSEAPDTGVNSITADADGALWFGMSYRSKIGRISTDGVSTAFDLTNTNDRARQVALGVDGNVWYANSGSVGKVTSQGEVVDFYLGSGREPSRPTIGADGAMWFWITAPGKLLRVTTAGEITTHDAPYLTDMRSLTAGPNDKLWFADRGSARIGSVDISNLP